MTRESPLAALAAVHFGLCLTLAACADAPLEPGPAFDFAASAGHTGVLDVVQSVTGSGHAVEAALRDRTTTFHVFKRADGTVGGELHTVARGKGGAKIRVRAECLHVVGHQAWVTGVVVAAEDPANIGLPYSYRFVDNGEGGRAAADEIAVARFQYYDCTTEPDLATRPLRIGDLQVRG